MSQTRLTIRRLIIHTHDLFAIIIAWYLAYLIRFNFESVPTWASAQAMQILPYVVAIQWCSFFIIGVHRILWSLVSLHDFIKIIKAAIFGCLCIALTLFLTNSLFNIPRLVFPCYVVLLIMQLSGSRLAVRYFKHKINNHLNNKLNKLDKIRVLIVGAGEAGEGIAREMLRSNEHSFIPVAFVDDKLTKYGKEIHGIRVVGTCKDIPEVVKKLHIQHIMLAIPSANSKVLRTLFSHCKPASLPISTLPSIKNLVLGKVSVDSLRNISIEDLIGREEITIDWNSISSNLKDQTVLVTGAGGSIGSELCRQISSLGVKTLIALDTSEYNIYMLEQELKSKHPQQNIVFAISDIRDQSSIRHIFATHAPEIVFHAAAYKHVPMMEHNIREAVYNNAIGTYHVASCAIKFNVKKVVLVSTDKAVNPTNIMGTTKRMAEIICQAHNNHDIKFMTVRFGNVIDSAGSVIPMFRKQIEAGGPITVTHPDITRFFMSIPEATQLILQAACIGNGGEIFILEMGEPVKILSIAEQMVALAGKVINEDINVVFTGLRPGEKMFEELFHATETLEKTQHSMILKAKARHYELNTIHDTISQIIKYCEEYNEDKILALIKQLVPEYNAALICS